MWQTQGAQTLLPQSTTGNSGILGRIIQAFTDQAEGTGEPPLKGAAYSITSSRTIFRSSPVEPVLLSSSSGMITYLGSKTAAEASNPTETAMSLRQIERLVGKEALSLFASTHNTVVRDALAASARISALLANATLTQNWDAASNRASAGNGKAFVGQMQQVA